MPNPSLQEFYNLLVEIDKIKGEKKYEEEERRRNKRS